MAQNPNDLTDDELLSLDFSDPLLAKLTPTERSRRLALVTQRDTATASAEGPQGTAGQRFRSGAWQNLNPVTMAKGAVSAVRHPLDTAGQIGNAQIEELKKAIDDYHAGRYSEMVGHGGASILPILGPAASAAGERIATGDVAGGIGEGAGLLAPFFAASAARGVKGAVRAGVQGARAIPKGAEALDAVAKMADDAAVNRLVDVAGPKVGPNKARLNNKLADVAPKLLRDEDLSALSREGFHTKVQAKLSEAEAGLDAAAANRNAKLVYHTKPIITALKKQRARQTSETVRSGRVTAGEDVVPSPNAPRVAVIDRAITELEQLGPIANYESLRRIREAYDGPAKATYSPSMTADYLKAQGSKLGAADVTGTLREHLAQMDPTTAAANAEYALYRSADDILKATAETERARPKVLRGVLARGSGAIAGANSGGVVGAGLGVMVGTMVQRAAELAPTTKILVARQLAKAADFLRAGKPAQAQAAVQQANSLIQTSAKIVRRTAAPTGQILERTGLPRAAEDREQPPATTGRR